MLGYFPSASFLFLSGVFFFFVMDVYCDHSIARDRSVSSSVTVHNTPGGEPQGFASSRLETSNVIAGKEALDFELEDLVGKKVHLKDFRGSLVLLNFWATWCLPCVSEMAALERLYKTYEKQGLQIVAVNVDAKNNAARVRDFVKTKSLSFTVLLDPNMSLAERYGLTGFPETFFIDAQGKIRLVHDPESNQDAVRLLSDRPWDSKLYLKLVAEFLPPYSPSSSKSQSAFLVPSSPS